MNLDRSLSAVSPVVAVILMVAITVILSAVIGTFVLNLGNTLSDSSTTSYDISLNTKYDGTTYTATVVSGSTSELKLLVNGTVQDRQRNVSAGDRLTAQASPGSRVTIVDAESTNRVLLTDIIDKSGDSVSTVSVVWETASDWDSAVSATHVDHRTSPTKLKSGHNDSFEDTDFSEYNTSTSVSQSSLSTVGSYSADIGGKLEYEFPNATHLYVESWVQFEHDTERVDFLNSAGVDIFLATDGVVYWYNGSRHTVFNPSPDTWYRVRVLSNTTAETVDITVWDSTGNVVASKSFTGMYSGSPSEATNVHSFDFDGGTHFYHDGLTIRSNGGGNLTTASKTFSEPVKPDLSNLAYTLNGGTINITVIGSPGQADEERTTVTLSGSSSRDLTWSASHTEFNVNIDLSHPDATKTPTLSSAALNGTT